MKNDKMKKVPRPVQQGGAVSSTPAAIAKSAQRTLNAGLDILEYLAKCQQPATPSVISAGLRVSRATVNHSLSVLQSRGYVAFDAGTQSYHTTGKVLALRPGRPLSPQLLELARPIMHELCEEISQPCNIAVISQAELKVIAQHDSPAAFGILVPVGFAYDIPNSAPGLAYVAFNGTSDSSAWPDRTPVTDALEWSALRTAVQKTADTGLAQLANSILPEVTDLSCPIYQNGQFVAVLTVPFLQVKGSANLAWSIAALQVAAERLSQSMHNDSLVA